MKITDDQKAAAAEMLMAAYLAVRDSMKPEGGQYVEELKSSFEIAQDLGDMFFLSTEEVSTYLIMRGYSIVTAEDGTPRWQLFRKIE